MGSSVHTGVLIIGTGFSGLGMAIQLRKSGREDFLLLEKADDIGGTWRDNTYPGCACDIQSHMYSFSYEQNPNWTRSFSPQQEIWDYLLAVTDKHSLRERIQFGAEVTSAHYDADDRLWRVSTTTGAAYTAPVLVAGVGALHVPRVPEIAGLADFAGETFHSAQWNHDYDLRGKRVAVIGTGASAIQFIPKIAPDVQRLSVFQRTPPWIMPKPDHAMPGWAKWLFRGVPLAQRAYRDAIYWLLESRGVGFNGHPAVMHAAERLAKLLLRRQVPDPRLRAKLTPNYTMGCKRVLLSNDYYPTFNRDNVRLITDEITRVSADAVITADGVEHEVDAIIFGTGFHVVDAFDHLDVIGRDGDNLAKRFAANGVQTYLGINVTGFPNLFFLLGPNTGLGHNSVVFMIEQQAKYVIRCLELLDRTGAVAMDVLPSAQRRFNDDIQRRLADGVWTKGGCTSWYLDAQGVNRTIWPGATWRYWLTTRNVTAADYELLAGERQGAVAGELVASTRA
ncbi:MAG: NAD(P)/FAD-dependent oxidoreductase [Sciscionella sp.]|nr:NAD(P)/FAD-dependent oxidoreductase [Sciscionella sp.]